MNFVNFLVIFCFIKFASSDLQFDNSTEDFSVSAAIADICNHFFIKESINFDLIIYGESTRHLDDVLDGILGFVGKNFTKTVKHVESIFKWNHKIEDSAVVLFYNLDHLIYFNSHVNLLNLPPKIFRFVIYCEICDDFEIPGYKYYDTDLPHISELEYFVVNENSSIHFKAFNYFMENSCNQKKFKTLNIFNKTSQKWKENFQNYKNFENFNGCMLTCTDEFDVYLHLNKYNSELIKCVTSTESFEFCLNLFIDIMSRPGVGVRGITYEIFEALSKRANFTANYQFSASSFVIPRTEYIINQKITIYRVGLYKEHVESTQMSTTFFDIQIGIFMSPTELYTNFEKLLLPFDDTTWIFLVAIFSTAAIFTFVMKFMPKNIRRIFYGRGIKTPGLNVIQIFFGIGQTHLPNESLLRFILIFFVLFCLIMRTCYQSKMFDFITSDMRKPPPKTLEDVIEQGYTVVLLDYSALYQSLYNEVRVVKRR